VQGQPLGGRFMQCSTCQAAEAAAGRGVAPAADVDAGHLTAVAAAAAAFLGQPRSGG
jgi:hypothetical protein